MICFMGFVLFCAGELTQGTTHIKWAGTLPASYPKVCSCFKGIIYPSKIFVISRIGATGKMLVLQILKTLAHFITHYQAVIIISST